MAKSSKNATNKKESKIQLYRILPVFKKSMMLVLGFVATQRVAQALDTDMTPEHWRMLFRNEMECQITAAIRQSLLDEEQVNRLADRWLTEKAASEVFGTKLQHKAELFAELSVSEGMLIDPQSPYQVVMEYLQARMEGDRATMERIVRETSDRSFDTTMKTDEFLSFNPVERLEMMLANMALRGPSGGGAMQGAANSDILMKRGE